MSGQAMKPGKPPENPKRSPALSDGDELLTVPEVAQLARCSALTVRRAYRAGHLIARRRPNSRAVLLLRSEVEVWVRAPLTEPVLPPATVAAAPEMSGERRAPRDRFVERAEAALRARGRLA